MALLILAAAIAGLACSGTATGPETGSSWFRATIEASESEGFEGSGTFSLDPDIRRGISERIQITSVGRGESAGKTMGFYRDGAGLPETGPHPIGPPDTGSFYSFYHRREDGYHRSYVAKSGTIRFAAAGPEHVEGTFTYTAILYCSVAVDGWDSVSWCSDAREVSGLEREQIQVEGSFSAAYADRSLAELL